MSKVDQLTLDIERLTAKRDAMLRLPEDDSWAENGTMIMFKRTFPGSDTVYTYVAIKQAGVWWTSTRMNTRSNLPMNWDQLVEWLGSYCTEMWHLEISGGLLKDKKENE